MNISRIFQRQWTEQSVSHWSAQRLLGRWRWVFLHGLFGFGTCAFTVAILLYFLVEGTDQISRGEVLKDLCTWLITGFLWGLIFWSMIERSYLTYLNQKKNENIV